MNPCEGIEMCGRFNLLTDLAVVADTFNIQHVSCHYQKDSDISPGRQVVAFICKDHQNVLVNFRWGLIPSWATDPAIGNRMFNARAETITEKASFKSAFEKRRCLVVADGFYEWQKQGKAKKPFYFGLKSGQPFGLAGLYESWSSPDHREIHSCTIITTDANDLIKPVHDRMPVILAKENESAWLSGDYRDRGALLSMLKPYPSDAMEMKEALLPRRSGNACIPFES
jgi:putative SOS response-associated peptidase YedK